jgi:Flp pilus assembly pilin Flp
LALQPGEEIHVSAGRIGLGFLRSLWHDETGVSALEYGLVSSLVAIVIIGALNSLQVKLKSVLNIVSSAL